jgi:hypothetical protein
MLRQLVECRLKVFTTGIAVHDLDELPLLMKRKFAAVSR